VKYATNEFNQPGTNYGSTNYETEIKKREKRQTKEKITVIKLL